MAGYCVVYTGPMFGCKTIKGLSLIGVLLGSTKNENTLKKALLINHSDDTRNLEQVFSTNDPIFNVNKDKIDMFKSSDLSKYKDVEHDFIMVDEYQFFKEESVDIISYWLEQKKYVIVCGLIADSNKKKMGHITDIILIADEFIQVRPFCSECTKEGKVNEFRYASFTKCTVEKTSQKLVGDGQIYAPVCRRHHKSIDTVESEKKLPNAYHGIDYSDRTSLRDIVKEQKIQMIYGVEEEDYHCRPGVIYINSYLLSKEDAKTCIRHFRSDPTSHGMRFEVIDISIPETGIPEEWDGERLDTYLKN